MNLNLGCGNQVLDGWTNVDHPTWGNPDADDHHDLDEIPWPWSDNCADNVLLDNVLEHLWDTHAVLLELHRITKPTGTIGIVVPHRDGPDACQADHKHLFDQHTLRPYLGEGKGRLGSKVSTCFRLLYQDVRHRHPYAWHQRRYLGRELLAWGPHSIVWTLQPIKDAGGQAS